jgi:SAM-dependent methyltransferase
MSGVAASSHEALSPPQLVSDERVRCLACDAPQLWEFDSASLGGVSSDCRPFAVGAALRVCASCGHVHKRTDDGWKARVAQVYAEYELYDQTRGADQILFPSDGSKPVARLEPVLDRFQERFSLPAGGRMIDVGCGNGAFLRAFARRFPGWRLTGAEQNDRSRQYVDQIPEVEAFYAGDVAELDEVFDVVSMMFVLEHVWSPAAMLGLLRDKLAEHGLLLIHVPNFLDHPFDLLCLDHCSHFTPASLENLGRRQGLKVESPATDWVPKDISVVFGRGPEAPAASAGRPEDVLSRVERSLAWLAAVRDSARQLASATPTGVFGTAIAGVWLTEQLGGASRFFVDEDPSRVGTTQQGVPVVHPNDVPAGHAVYVGLPPQMAQAITARLRERYPNTNWVLPPAF